MGLFRRRRDGDRAQDGERDEALTFMSVDDAQRVRSLVRQALAELGREATVYADHATDSAGNEYGLWNVAATCHASGGRGEWPAIVREHMGRIVAASDAPSPFETLTTDELLPLTYCRVYDAETIADLPHLDVAPGLVEMLAADLPDTVVTYNEDAVARHGGWAALRSHGLANLRREQATPAMGVEVGNGGRLNVLDDISVHTASRVLVLPELTAGAGDPVGDYGWLMAVPDRHRLLWHVIRDASVVPSLDALARVTLGMFAEAPNSISPHVYWWNGAEYRRLTSIGDGAPRIEVDEEFAAVLNAVTGGPAHPA